MSGVYIKGMEMPMCEKECKFYEEAPFRSPYCAITGVCGGLTNCPLIPAADVRPVVRCKDCRHRDPEDHKCDSGEMERQGCPFKVADDYFCAYGER